MSFSIMDFNGHTRGRWLMLIKWGNHLKLRVIVSTKQSPPSFLVLLIESSMAEHTPSHSELDELCSHMHQME